MKKLDSIQKSDEMKRLVSLTSEAEALKWVLSVIIERACPVHGCMEEPLVDWEKRLDAVGQLIDSKDVQAVWNDGTTEITTNPLWHLRLEVQKARETIQRHRAAGHKDVVEFEG